MSERKPSDPSGYEQLTEVTADVSHYINLLLIKDDGGVEPFGANLLYSQRDPFAVQVLFNPGTEYESRWAFARELLAEGLYTPTGQGNVQVWPDLSASGEAAVTLELFTPRGEETMIQALAKDMANFVGETKHWVPVGEESMNFDTELVQLFQGPQPGQ